MLRPLYLFPNGEEMQGKVFVTWEAPGSWGQREDLRTEVVLEEKVMLREPFLFGGAVIKFLK